jgi:tRNA-dihydrouridine synthase
MCVGNGDVVSRAQGEALAAEHGVDGVMVGRGIFSDPWLFGEQEGGERESNTHSPTERLALLVEHAKFWEKQWCGEKSFDLMRKFTKVYCSGWEGAADLRARLMQCRSATEIEHIVHEGL